MRFGLCLCGLIVSVGCGTQLSFTRTGQGAVQARGPAQVEVFTKGGPARPSAELGVIEARAEDGAPLKEMREYAGELGCDALVMLAADNPQQPDRYRASCLVYTSPPLLPPPPSAAGPSGTTTCIPNTPQPCYGTGGCRGNQTCNGDGKSFTQCDCSP